MKASAIAYSSIKTPSGGDGSGIRTSRICANDDSRTCTNHSFP